MRDLALILILVAYVRLVIGRPWVGVLALAVVAYMQPHGYGSTLMQGFPYYLAVFVPVMLGLVLSSEPGRGLPRDWRVAVFGLLWLMFVLTTLFATMPWYAWVKLGEVSKVLAGVALTLVLIDTRQKLLYLVATIALSIGLVAFKGGYWALMTGFADRVYGPPLSQFEGNNHFAVLVIMTLPLLVLWWREISSRPLRVFIGGFVVLSIAAALSSWSRGALLALTTVLLLLVWHSRYKWISLPMLGLALALVLFGLPDDWMLRMQSIATYESDYSATSRLDIWRQGLEYSLIHPWLGVGFDGWTALAEMDWHNAFVEVLAEHGYGGFLLWIGLLVGSLWDLTRLGRVGRSRADLAWVTNYSEMMRASLAGYAVGAMFSGLAYWDILFHLVAMAVVLRRLANDAQAAPVPIGPNASTIEKGAAR